MSRRNQITAQCWITDLICVQHIQHTNHTTLREDSAHPCVSVVGQSVRLEPLLQSMMMMMMALFCLSLIKFHCSEHFLAQL